MVCDYAHGHVFLSVNAVFLAGKFFYLVNHSGEHICVIVALLALESHAEALEAHARVNIPVRQKLKLTACLSVVLHEHEVPYLYHKMMSLVHKLPSRKCCNLLVAPEVNVYFAAWSARACVAHLPEVVMLVSEQNPVLRKIFLPCLHRLCVELGPVFLRTFKHGSIELSAVDFIYFGKKFPCPVNGLCLEIVTEAPVAEHLEHGVVVRVVSHLFKVIVFPADPQAFLTVGHARPFRCAVSEEPVLELVHSCVCEHQCRVILNYHRCRRHYLVAF